jgi:hypothetical protein
VNVELAGASSATKPPNKGATRMDKIATTIAVAVFAVGAAACGSTTNDESAPTLSSEASESGETTPAASDEPAETDVPAQDVAADAAAAEAALLTLSDFPAGWSEVPAEDDEEDDSSDEMGERTKECFGSSTDTDIVSNETRARTGEFTDPADDSTVTQGVSLGSTVELTEDYMAAGSADGVAACLTIVFREGYAELLEDAEEMQDAELGEITVGALNVGEVGEDTFAYRITIPITVQGFTVDFVFDLVAVRVGRSVSSLVFGSTFDPTPTERITEYTTLAASRLPG